MTGQSPEAFTSHVFLNPEQKFIISSSSSSSSSVAAAAAALVPACSHPYPSVTVAVRINKIDVTI